MNYKKLLIWTASCIAGLIITFIFTTFTGNFASKAYCSNLCDEKIKDHKKNDNEVLVSIDKRLSNIENALINKGLK